jgi:hypothetical protein
VTDEVIARHYAAHPNHLELLNREIERIDLGVRAMQSNRVVVAQLRGLTMRA